MSDRKRKGAVFSKPTHPFEKLKGDPDNIEKYRIGGKLATTNVQAHRFRAVI